MSRAGTLANASERGGPTGAAARHRARDWWRRHGLRDLAIFSLPAVVLILITLISALADYAWTQQFDDAWSRMQSFRRILGLKILSAVHVPAALALEQRMNPESDDPAIVRLDVSPAAWEQIAGDRKVVGTDDWVDANILRGNTFHPVKLRLRGDTSLHWLTPKRSFTLRTSTSELFKGYRRLAFSCKDVLAQFVTGRLAAELGLLAPDTFISPVYLNDRFYGLYRVIEIPDESFLRHQNRMPGNIYRGDAAERGEYFKGVERSLFCNPYIWDKAAANERPGAPPGDAIRALLPDLNGRTFEDHQRFMEHFDRDELSRLVALMLLCGDMCHMSGVHNQLWYEDPSSGLLHPIPWDVELADVRKPPFPLNELLLAVFRDAATLDGALRVLAQRLRNDDILRFAGRIADEMYRRQRVYFDYDTLRVGSVNRVGTPDEVIAQLRENVSTLRAWMDDCRVAVLAGPALGSAQPADWQIMDLETRGYAGAELVAVELAVKPGNGAGAGLEGQEPAPSLFADRDLDGVPSDGDTPIAAAWAVTPAGGRLELDQPLALLSGTDTTQTLIQPSPMHYRLLVHGGAGREISSLRPVLRNRLTGAGVTPAAAEPGSPAAYSASWHPWRWPQPAPREVRLSGAVELTQTLTVQPHETLVIEAGTTIRLAPDVSILVRGRAVAQGTAEAPITLTALHALRPWGTLALLGHGADGSRFAHCSFTRGGGATLGRVEFKGMINVHWAADVRFERCEFAENVRCDDGINAVHSRVDIEHCHFHDTNADAIDYDYSVGTILDNDIERAGNDGCDLMTCRPRIIGNRIRGSGDKGISVGEGSLPLIFNNVIENCVRGIEVKDNCEPLIAHNVLRGNRIGLLENARSWRYPGAGWAKLINTVVADSGDENVKSLDRSRLTDSGSLIGEQASGRTLAATLLLASWGVGVADRPPGTVQQFDLFEPRAPLWSQEMADDFEDAADGWHGVPTLRKREGNLIVETHGSRVIVERDVEWNLTGAAESHALLLELSGQSVESVRVSVGQAESAASEDGSMEQAAAGFNDPARYRFVALPLRPGRYRSVRIEIEPAGRDARLFLHAARVVSWPAEGHRYTRVGSEAAGARK